MGRYSSVQAYADNNAGVRKVPYEQAAAAASSDGSKKPAAVKPEKVVNPYGSTAGAGSGDFHVYRHARNRELQRQQQMELSAVEQEAEEKFQHEQAANRKWEEERTAKRRRKRERQKNAKKRKENLAKAGIVSDATSGGGVRAVTGEEHAEQEQFTYTPGDALKPLDEEDEVDDEDNSQTSKEKEAAESNLNLPPNDGSFLDMMKQKLAEQQNGATEKAQQEPTNTAANEAEKE